MSDAYNEGVTTKGLHLIPYKHLDFFSAVRGSCATLPLCVHFHYLPQTTSVRTTDLRPRVEWPHKHYILPAAKSQQAWFYYKTNIVLC